jgi:hypothetical protein
MADIAVKANRTATIAILAATRPDPIKPRVGTNREPGLAVQRINPPRAMAVEALGGLTVFVARSARPGPLHGLHRSTVQSMNRTQEIVRRLGCHF